MSFVFVVKINFQVVNSQLLILSINFLYIIFDYSWETKYHNVSSKYILIIFFQFQSGSRNFLFWYIIVGTQKYILIIFVVKIINKYFTKNIKLQNFNFNSLLLICLKIPPVIWIYLFISKDSSIAFNRHFFQELFFKSVLNGFCFSICLLYHF